MAVSAFGFGTGTPGINPAQFFGGSSPYGLQGPSLSPFATQQPYGQPLLNSPLSSVTAGNASQQIVQLLQAVPQQLQQLQQLAYAQQQQLLQIQQLLQQIPGQLLQLQYLIQSVPQQIQQASSATLPGSAAFATTPSWGMAPQLFAQPGQVM
jgi:hypothetical protein